MPAPDELFIKDPFDQERDNFVHWYTRATQEELDLARKNNPEKFDELLLKYRLEVRTALVFKGQAETRR